MNIEEMLKQQEKRGLKQNTIKAKMQSYDDYVKDDTSPRPYNTPNVLDLFTDLNKSTIDTKTISSAESIRDTKTTSSAESIRDTKTTSSAEEIRDTKTTPGAGGIRDTKTTPGAGEIRDTKTIPSAEGIRDTKTIPSAGEIRDTKTTSSAEWIRDTKTIPSAEWIRDTKTIPSAESIRDTKTIPSAEGIRDTTTIPSAEGIRDTKNRDTPEKTPRTGRPAKGNKYQYSDLSGNLKKLVDEIANRCVVLGDLTIPNIDKFDFSKKTGVKIGAIKTTVIRLNEKGVITYYEATKGRNSSWKFVLSSKILDQYIRSIRGN